MPEYKTLYILRHGNASNINGERRLNDAGIKECKLIKSYLEEEDDKPDIVLCSDSIRTKETAAIVVKEMVKYITYTNKLYNASLEDLLSQISSVTGDISSFMIIAHNPGLHNLAVFLSSYNSKDIRISEFPTASLARFNIDCEWHDISSKNCYLDYFIYPSMIKD